MEVGLIFFQDVLHSPHIFSNAEVVLSNVKFNISQFIINLNQIMGSSVS